MCVLIICIDAASSHHIQSVKSIGLGLDVSKRSKPGKLTIGDPYPQHGD